MTARTARLGILGFDTNTPLTAQTAKRFHEHGYEFALRYVPRLVHHEHDLTRAEANAIRSAGLGLSVVQHVEPGRWTPSREKGKAYGHVAAQECLAITLAPRTSVWLDLESVAPGVPSDITIGYCNAWFAEVRASGFTPGVYVGWSCGLSATELYRRLTCRAYWSAYNANADDLPIVRGVQMRQRAAKPDDLPNGLAFPIDVNVITGDALHGFPMIDFGEF